MFSFDYFMLLQYQCQVVIFECYQDRSFFFSELIRKFNVMKNLDFEFQVIVDYCNSCQIECKKMNKLNFLISILILGLEFEMVMYMR